MNCFLSREDCVEYEAINVYINGNATITIKETLLQNMSIYSTLDVILILNLWMLSRKVRVFQGSLDEISVYLIGAISQITTISSYAT